MNNQCKSRVKLVINFMDMLLIAFILIMLGSIISKHTNTKALGYNDNIINMNIINFDNNVSIDKKNSIESAANLIPKRVFSMVSKEYIINVVDTPIEEILKNKYNQNVEFATGVTNHDDRTIYVNDKYPKSFVHEFGHAYSNLNGSLHLSNEWVSLYNKEKDKFNSTYEDKYISKNSSEFFAEMFAKYCLEPENLQSISPNIYNYFNKLLEK